MTDPVLSANDLVAPCDEPPRKPTLLHGLVDEYRSPTGLVAAAVLMAPTIVDVPLIHRYEVWGAVAVFAVLVVTAFLTRSRVILAGVAAVTLVGFAGAELAIRVAGPARAAERPAPPRPTSTEVGGNPIVTIRAFDRRWVLHGDGTIHGLSDHGTLEVTYHVRGPAAAMTACGEALVVTHGNGTVARVSPTGGAVLTRYRYGWHDGDVVCGGGHLWVSKPDGGSVVQLGARRLNYVDEFPIAKTATSITFGRGAIWVLDGPRRQVVGVGAATKQKLGPYAVMDDAQQILFVGGYIWVLHRKQSCLMRLDLGRGAEIGPGVALGRFPFRIHARDGAIYVADYAEASILRVDVRAARRTHRPIALGPGGRLTDVDEFGGRLIAVDTARSRVVFLGPAAREALRAKRAYDATAQCPRR